MDPIATQAPEALLMSVPVSHCGGPTVQRITLWPMLFEKVASAHCPEIQPSRRHGVLCRPRNYLSTSIGPANRAATGAVGRPRAPCAKYERPSFIGECKEESQKVQMLVRFILVSMCEDGGQVYVMRIAAKCDSQISCRALDEEGVDDVFCGGSHCRQVGWLYAWTDYAQRSTEGPGVGERGSRFNGISRGAAFERAARISNWATLKSLWETSACPDRCRCRSPAIALTL